jgi:Cu(I)/Ag(I) efflux system membrane protein CusA/SilA
MERASERLRTIVPITLLLVFFLLYLNFRTIKEASLVMGLLPFALIGGIWLLYALDYDLSVAVGVGFIALAGVAAETGVVMVLYLRHAMEDIERHGGTVEGAIVDGASERVRPIVMTVCAIIFGLLPIMWSSGAGADVMKRIAAPMIGGMLSTTLLTLLVLPVFYSVISKRPTKSADPEPNADPEPDADPEPEAVAA